MGLLSFWLESDTRDRQLTCRPRPVTLFEPRTRHAYTWGGVWILDVEPTRGAFVFSVGLTGHRGSETPTADACRDVLGVFQVIAGDRIPPALEKVADGGPSGAITHATLPHSGGTWWGRVVHFTLLLRGEWDPDGEGGDFIDAVEGFDDDGELAQPPHVPADPEWFWTLMPLTREGSHERLVQHLATLPVERIYAFEETLAQPLHAIDGPEWMRSSDVDGSSDGFLYARCAVVASGRDRYHEVLTRPSRMPKRADFEALLGIAQDAFVAKTGKAFTYSASVDYETGRNSAHWSVK